MSIIWVGSEEIDFPTLPGGTSAIATISVNIRSGWARASVNVTNTASIDKIAQSLIFGVGTISSCWLSAQVALGAITVVSRQMVGVGVSGASKGLYVSTENSSGSKLALVKIDGTTRTQLAAESGNSIAASGTVYKIDMQVINFGASATVNVYVGGAGSPVITFTGDVTLSGMSTGFNCVNLGVVTSASGGMYVSEAIVADEDTRTFGLLTKIPNGLGATAQWSGTYTDVNEIANSDATAIISNVAAQDEQLTLGTNVPAGNWICKAVQVTARALAPAGSTAASVGLGVKNGSNVDVGSLNTAPTGGQTFVRLMATDPTKSAPWAVADLNTLGVVFRSGT